MFDGNNDGPKTVSEGYAGAVMASNLRVEAHKFTQADLVAAAGMNSYRMGMALMRLVSEWQSGATPRPGLAPSPKDLRKQGVSADLAEAESRRIAAQYADWHLQENMLRFQRLKTLPAVRAALLHWVGDKGWNEAENLVADTIRHFLSPVCTACEGRKRKVVQSRAIGPECRKCRGTGEADLRHGGRGRSLLSYMKQCTGQAADDLRSGAHKLRRSANEEEGRKEHRKHARVGELRRADTEARADAQRDTEADAAHFRDSLGRKRKKG